LGKWLVLEDGAGAGGGDELGVSAEVACLDAGFPGFEFLPSFFHFGVSDLQGQHFFDKSAYLFVLFDRYKLYQKNIPWSTIDFLHLKK
jgi:hypothetical protein